VSDKDPGEKRSSRAAIFVVVGLVVIVVAIAMSIWSSRHEDATAPAPQAAQPPAQPAPAQPAGSAKPDAQASAQPNTESKPGTSSTAPAAQQPAGEARPSFDVVRVARDGHMVMAGRAAPGATVIIGDGEKEVGRTKANDEGEWVFTPDQAAQPGSRELSLRAENPDGATKTGDAPVVLVVPERSKVASNAPSAGTGDAIAVKVKPGGEVQLLQVPTAKESSGPVSVGVVNFDEKGHLAVAGSAQPNASVQVYLDDALIGSATADGKGSWNIATEHPLGDGNHTVRADQLAANGKVAGRAEIGFTAGGGGPTSGQVTVATGNSLWRIARHAYGNGLNYIVIFRANQEQIRNPDLIYPGQIFKLPTKG
jgi:nucleoid-associated protein YgaU